MKKIDKYRISINKKKSLLLQDIGLIQHFELFHLRKLVNIQLMQKEL